MQWPLTRPPPSPVAAVTGYTAGWLATPLPAACEGLSARSCLACQGLATAAAVNGCLKCAKLSAPDDSKIFFNGIKAITRAETCAFCYNTTGANADA
jgi:hypothetical protein